MSSQRIMDKMFYQDVGNTTTFWSEQDLENLIKSKQPQYIFDNSNKSFDCIGGVGCIYLKYGSDLVGEFGFGHNFDSREDIAKWQELYDASTNKRKFRLYFANNYGPGGTQAPADIHIRPLQYDQSWKLAWKYKAKDEMEIEIFRVEDENNFESENVIHTLSSSDFNANGVSWLRNRSPIVIQKHKTYITICASAHLKRFWQQQVADQWHKPAYDIHVMSDDEAAWIERDNIIVLRNLQQVPQHATAVGGLAAVKAMLGALQALAE